MTIFCSMGSKKAVFFCSASDRIDPKFNEAAREAVRAVCACGFDIKSGGTTKGTMKVVCDEVRACGAKVEAAVPRFMMGLEYPDLDVCIWTDTMSQRKEAMREGTSLAVALPGGIGTLDELMETLVLVKLHKYPGRVIAFSVDKFYEPLRNLLDYLVQMKMLEQCDRDLITFPETIEEFKAQL